MRIAYVGRFAPGWATEADMAAALRKAGHDVDTYDESAFAIPWAGYDLVVWTPSDVRIDPACLQFRLHHCDGPPVVGYHLDRWFGLRRETDLRESSVLRCDLLVTADGAHDDDWANLGVKHRWLPPAIAADEAALIGTRRAEFDADVVFVGSWQHYHREWPHRRQLVDHLRRWFGPQFKLWPRGGPVVRGQKLSDIYASARVVVGDSCGAGGGSYFSDRVPDVLGRGGFLLHPDVDGMEAWFKAGEHLATWPAHDWRGLRDALGYWLAKPDDRGVIAEAGRAHVLEHHTYDVRATQLLDACRQHGLL